MIMEHSVKLNCLNMHYRGTLLNLIGHGCVINKVIGKWQGVSRLLGRGHCITRVLSGLMIPHSLQWHKFQGHITMAIVDHWV